MHTYTKFKWALILALLSWIIVIVVLAQPLVPIIDRYEGNTPVIVGWDTQHDQDARASRIDKLVSELFR